MNSSTREAIAQSLAEIRDLLRNIKMEEISEAAAERLARCWELVADIQEQFNNDRPLVEIPAVEPTVAAMVAPNPVPAAAPIMASAPAPVAAAPAPAAVAPPVEISKKSASLIAIVDDDPDVQRMLTFVLKRKGFGVQSFFDPKEALTQIVQANPSVIILDLMMPQMTGFEFLEQFKGLRSQLPGVRIIVGSARSFDSDRLAVLKAGANDFVAKPYNLDELVLRIHNLMAA